MSHMLQIFAALDTHEAFQKQPVLMAVLSIVEIDLEPSDSVDPGFRPKDVMSSYTSEKTIDH